MHHFSPIQQLLPQLPSLLLLRTAVGSEAAGEPAAPADTVGG
jgi:hypothetical protein